MGKFLFDTKPPQLDIPSKESALIIVRANQRYLTELLKSFRSDIERRSIMCIRYLYRRPLSVPFSSGPSTPDMLIVLLEQGFEADPFICT